MDEIQVRFKLNGREIDTKVQPNLTLLDFLRRQLRVTSVKRGCEVGECGACTVLLNGEPVLSCLVLAPTVDGKEIVTIEGVSKVGISPIQKAFVNGGAIQCGFCTPAMVLVAKALLDRNPNPSIDDIRKAIEGNLCRCTGYVKIIDAISTASKEINRSRPRK